jgi:CheY-like chemotaxis protein
MPDLHLMIVDDDEVSREVLSLLAEADGYRVTTAESGDAALAAIANGVRPDAILTDMQMPGTSGTALAEALHQACGAGIRVIGMSASGTGAPGFDGFLLKPFEISALTALIAGAEPLNDATYASLQASMPAQQVRALYRLCLDDAERRIARMRDARDAADSVSYIREAHAIKGGCGMVGATELHRLAGAMEENGLSSDEGVDSLDGFLAASARLRRILEANVEND